MGFSSTLFDSTTLPNFLIIGAQKAGTTSLASYLAAHPDVIAPKWKEVHFFDLNYARGVEWYRSHFVRNAAHRLRASLRIRRAAAGDATPYYMLHPRAPIRAADLIPAARIIVLLRILSIGRIPIIIMRFDSEVSRFLSNRQSKRSSLALRARRRSWKHAQTMRVLSSNISLIWRAESTAIRFGAGSITSVLISSLS